MNPIYLDYNERRLSTLWSSRRCNRSFANSVATRQAPTPTARRRSRRWCGLRVAVAGLLGAKTSEIIFTSGGTEATDHALKGLVLPALIRGGGAVAHTVISAIENPATSETCGFLERLGCRSMRVPVDRDGVLELDRLEHALRRPTTLMHANNEVGALQPIRAIPDVAHAARSCMRTRPNPLARSASASTTSASTCSRWPATGSMPEGRGCPVRT